MFTEVCRLQSAQLLVQRNKHVRNAEVPIIFRDFILQDQMTAECVPCEIREHTMILMTVISIMSKNEIRPELLQCFKEILNLSALKRKEAALEMLADNPRLLNAPEKGLRAGARFADARTVSTEHDPKYLKTFVVTNKLQQGAATSDFDIIRVRADTQNPLDAAEIELMHEC